MVDGGYMIARIVTCAPRAVRSRDTPWARNVRSPGRRMVASASGTEKPGELPCQPTAARSCAERRSQLTFVIVDPDVQAADSTVAIPMPTTHATTHARLSSTARG